LLDSESVDCVMTSPPYWALRDYGTATWEGGDPKCDHRTFDNDIENAGEKQKTNKGSMRTFKEVCRQCGAVRKDKQLGLEPTFQEYITKLCDIFDEVKRVLKDDGSCWINMGDTYFTTTGAGYFDRGNCSFGQEEKYGQKAGGNYKGLKPKADQLPQKSLCQIPSRFAIEMSNRGWILRSDIIWWKPNCMPSSVKDRFTVDYEHLFFFVKNRRYYFETQYESYADIRKPITKEERIAKGNWQGSNRGLEMRGGFKNLGNLGNYQTGRNMRAVWKIATKPFKEAHFAVFPEELCETPIKAGCPVNGVVLDPFIGSGTTGVVALKQRKRFIGFELNPEYVKIAQDRIRPYLEQKALTEGWYEP